jgi:hypothetical protein
MFFINYNILMLLLTSTLFQFYNKITSMLFFVNFIEIINNSIFSNYF